MITVEDTDLHLDSKDVVKYKMVVTVKRKASLFYRNLTILYYFILTIANH